MPLSRPPLLTLLQEVLGWTLDRTGDLPKSQVCCIEAITSIENLFLAATKARLWELQDGITDQLARVRFKLAEPKSRLLTTGEGVPFCGFLFHPGLRPRILGTTKRRFEARRYVLFRQGNFKRLGVSIFAWYQFSREGNSEGLRRAYVRWPLAARLKRRQRRTSRVVRGGSWINNNPENLSCSYRNNNHPENRNNIGVVCVGGWSR